MARKKTKKAGYESGVMSFPKAIDRTDERCLEQLDEIARANANLSHYPQHPRLAECVSVMFRTDRGWQFMEQLREERCPLFYLRDLAEEGDLGLIETASLCGMEVNEFVSHMRSIRDLMDVCFAVYGMKANWDGVA